MARLHGWYMVTPAPLTVNAAWKGAVSFVLHIYFFNLFLPCNSSGFVNLIKGLAVHSLKRARLIMAQH